MARLIAPRERLGKLHEIDIRLEEQVGLLTRGCGRENFSLSLRLLRTYQNPNVLDGPVSLHDAAGILGCRTLLKATYEGTGP